MVDVTFPFIILLGGLLVGIVTARVRRHRGWRQALDILVAAICGPIATTLWMRVVPRLFERAPDEPYLSRGWAFVLSDVLWFSPVIGGFVGVAAVAIGFRLAGHGPVRPHEGWGEKIGDGIRIVGWVYAVISLALIVGVVILAVSFESTGVLTPLLFVDLVIGPVIILIGWVIARLFRTADTQPGVPFPS
jgi:MFS family permease